MTKISSLTELLGAGVDQANDLLTIVDMSEVGAARNKKLKVTQLLGLITDLVGMLELKGSTDCSANPNYPAASKGDTYRVSVAGKIGGASGVTVEVGDVYYALADNAGGTQAAVGSSWDVIQGNGNFMPVAGGTFTGDIQVPAEAYGAGWDGSNEVPTKNDVYDKMETVAGGSVTSWKQAVRAATTAAGTLATSFENGDTIDGVTLATGDRILIKNQATATENGVYTVNASGAPTRATDADSGDEMLGAIVAVMEGAVNADRIFQCTNNATITLGVTNLAFVELFDVGAAASQGDILVRGADGWQRLAAGTNGQMLRTGGTGANPAWVTPGMTQLAQITTSGNQTTVDFTSISGSYTNLRIVGQVRSQAAVSNDTIFVRFNNDSGSNYDQEAVTGSNNTSLSAAGATGQTQIALVAVTGANATANYATAFTLDIPNYAATTFNKSCIAIGVGRTAAATPMSAAYGGGDWNSTAAITRVTLILNAGGAFANNLIFTLYGLL